MTTQGYMTSLPGNPTFCPVRFTLMSSLSHQRRFDNTMRSPFAEITHTYMYNTETRRKHDNSTTCTKRYRQSGEIHLLQVTEERIEYRSIIANMYSGKPKKKNKLQPIIWFSLCIQVIVIFSLGIGVRLTVGIHICA